MRWFHAIQESVELLEANAVDIISRYQFAVEGLPTTEYIDHFGETEITF